MTTGPPAPRLRTRGAPAGDPWLLHRAVFAVLLLALALAHAIRSYAAVVAAGGGNHQTADWLIGYAAGPGRRGLVGEVFLRLAPQGQPGLWWLFALQVGLFAVPVAFLARHLVRSRFSWASIALVLGPAALPFTGWDPAGAFRKEVLIFAALALLAWAGHAAAVRRRMALTWAGVVLFVVAAFSWEATYAALPVALWLVGRPGPSRLPGGAPAVAGVVMGAAAVAAAVLGLATPGDADTAAALCAAVRAHGFDAPDLCSGAIAWMGYDAGVGRYQVRWFFPESLRFLPLGGLALLGLVTTGWARRHPWLLLATLVALAPLFALALDWGRWLHMAVVFGALAVAAEGPDPAAEPLWAGPGALAYVGAWGLPHSLGVAFVPGATGVVTTALVALVGGPSG